MGKPIESFRHRHNRSARNTGLLLTDTLPATIDEPTIVAWSLAPTLEFALAPLPAVWRSEPGFDLVSTRRSAPIAYMVIPSSPPACRDDGHGRRSSFDDRRNCPACECCFTDVPGTIRPRSNQTVNWSVSPRCLSEIRSSTSSFELDPSTPSAGHINVLTHGPDGGFVRLFL